MKNFFFLFVLFCFHASLASAQSKTPPPTQYLVYSYHKVAPGMDDNFVKLAHVWKKILINQTPLDTPKGVWSLSKMVTPIGAISEYDYVTLRVITGEQQLAKYLAQPYLPDNWQLHLTPDEIDLVLQADKIRTFVKLEVWPIIDVVPPIDTIDSIKVAVYNYFKARPCKTREAAVKMEETIWKPIHEARVKDNHMRLWFLLTLDFPFGTSRPYNMLTIDDYTDLNQYLMPVAEDYFKKVHPGKNMKKLLKETDAATTLVKGDVRIILDRQ